jgi:lysophospholipase L1-like esterase
MRRRLCGLAAALLIGPLLGPLASVAVAQSAPKTYVAFGDSITAGVGDDPARPSPGYPFRLQTLLQTVGQSVTVVNKGVGGERTPEGLSRIDGVLAAVPVKPGDGLILMEGTNDISRSISLETTIFNLDTMASKAEALGLGVIHATVIPREPDAKVDAANILCDQLNGSIRNLAGQRGRGEADPNEIFRNLPNLFGSFYSNLPDDPVGHPNPAGYDVLAKIFFNMIQGIDTVPPVPGLIRPANGAVNVKPGAAIQVDVWDFGTGIDLANTFLLVNGQVTDAVAQGTALHAGFVYQPPAPLSGTVTVGLRSRDLATPPNPIDRQIASFKIQGSPLSLQGDINNDGRVDGTDLILFGIHFGSQQGTANYSAAADLNADGSIDGLDLAILAANFGQVAPGTAP